MSISNQYCTATNNIGQTTMVQSNGNNIGTNNIGRISISIYNSIEFEQCYGTVSNEFTETSNAVFRFILKNILNRLCQ